MTENQQINSNTGTDTGKSNLAYGYVMVVCGFLILLVAFGINYSFGIFFNPLLADLQWSRAITSIGYSLAQFIGGIAGILTGKLSDRFSPKFIIAGCCLSLTLGCLLMSQVTEVWQFYACQGFLMGIGFGGVFSPLSSMAARWFVKRRGLMTGIVIAGVGCGTIVMPLLANRLLMDFSWQNSFLITGAIAFVAIIPAALLLKRAPKMEDPLMLTGKPSNTGSPKKITNLRFKEAIHTGQFKMFCAINLLFGYSGHSIMVHLVPQAKSLGFIAGEAAKIMSFVGAGSILGRITVGRISDYLGIKRTYVLVSIIMLIAFILLQVADQLWMFFLFALLFGFAFGGLIALQSLSMARYFGMISLGVLTGTVICMYTTGGAIGPAVTGYFFDVTQSYRWAFMVCVILTAIVLILALCLRQSQKKGSI